jgi:hypothetical protein
VARGRSGVAGSLSLEAALEGAPGAPCAPNSCPGTPRKEKGRRVVTLESILQYTMRPIRITQPEELAKLERELF